MPVVESEYRLALVPRHAATDADDILVKGAAHELEIAEDECLFWVETQCDNVAGVLAREADDVVD